MRDLTEEKPINPRGWLFAVAPSHSGLTAQLGEELGSSGEALSLEQAFARSWEQTANSWAPGGLGDCYMWD